MKLQEDLLAAATLEVEKHVKSTWNGYLTVNLHALSTVNLLNTK